MREHLSFIGIAVIFCILLLTGCGDDSDSSSISGSISEFQVLKSPGYYGDLRMMPNGVFLVRYKIADDKADNAGLVYKAEFNENNKLNKITAMQGGTPISVDWQDTLNKKFKFSAVTIEYNDKQTRYNFRSSRMAATTGYYDAYAIGYKLDDSGKNYTVAYLYNKEGEQSTASRGYSQMFFKYDNSNNLINIAFADEGGNRVINSDKEYEIHLKYDKKPNFPSEIANYAKDGSLLVDNTGIAKTTFKFDDKNRVIEVRHYGSDDMLRDKNSPNLAFDKVITSISAAAITRYSYEGNTDRISRIAFLGKDEQAEGIKAWGNISSFELKYTPEGWISSVASFATDDSPIPLSKDGFGDNVVKIETSHDAQGNMESMKFYGKDNNAVTASKLGAAEVRYKYDEKRRSTGESYYGTGGEPIEINDKGFNYHGFTYEYNDDDEITTIIYYDKGINEVRRENPKNTSANTPVPAPTSQTALNLQNYVGQKNQYDREITSIANEINAYLTSHPTLRGADGILNRANSLNARINQAKLETINLNVPNAAAKNKLIEVFDAELNRVEGLIEGMIASMNGGSYQPGFERGRAAAYHYDDVNAQLNALLP